ncbi:cell division protein FtsQ [Acetobacteraceae bacterium H6797]|nr:cell division protein FtsQ [Acetobacteraceae bacterium H6797]
MDEKTSRFRLQAHRLQAVATIALLGWGFWEGVQALSTPETREKLRQSLSIEALLDGRLAGAVNHAMAHALPADPVLRGTGSALRWELFGSAGPQVRAGCDGWLFLTEELRPWPAPEAAMAERIAVVERVREKLASQGIALLVALVPDKARIEAAHRCGIPYSAQSEGRLAALLDGFAKTLVPVVNLAPVLTAANQDGAAWYRTDTHWSQEGAAAAAKAVAEAAKRLTPGLEPRAFRTTAAASPSDGPGDLIRLMGLDIVPPALRPAPDRQRLETTEAEAAPAGGGGGGLLDETPAVPVALLGSSYSLNANFHGRLQEALGAEVTNAAQLGGGFHRAAARYLAGATFREAPPKLIIWEMPERVMTQPPSDEEKVFLGSWR